MKKTVIALSLLTALGTVVTAQQAQRAGAPPPPAPKMMTMANPFTSSTKTYYDEMKPWITKAASMVDEKDYGWHPTAAPAADKQEIRTFARLFAHITDANYLFCGTATGMSGPGQIENKVTAKADIAKALADSFAFCDKAWASTDDKNGTTGVSFPKPLEEELHPTTRLGALVMNNSHLSEHYGNIVTYMRVKGMVPPSSMPMGK